MCLATAYGKSAGKETVLCQYVSNIDINGKTITMTDVTGEKKVVEGVLIMADLAGGVVEINVD